MTAMYTMRRGGAYDRFVMMVEAFLERGWEVHCLSLTPIQIDHPFFHNHVMYFPLKKADGMMAKLWVLFLFPLWALWVGWRIRIDLIIAFGALYAFLVGPCKSILKRPMVTLIRLSSPLNSTTQKSFRGIFRINKVFQYLGLVTSDRIITNYHVSQDDIIKKLENRKDIEIDILYNNIPPIRISSIDEIMQIRKKYGIPTDGKIIVTAGIVNRRKNMGILIKCLPDIRVDNLYLMIVGDGSTKTDLNYLDSLKRLGKTLMVDHQVIFTGWVEKEELWKIYQASNLFVLPSLNEGMPNALLEALGYDLPCLGSDIPGINDILHYGDLLFDPANDEIIIDKIERFFAEEQYANHILQLCLERKKIFVFDWKEKLFQTLTQGNFHKDGAWLLK